MLGRDHVVDWRESVTTVNNRSLVDAIRAVIPVGADQALVTNTDNALVALVADCSMVNIATTIAQSASSDRKDCETSSCFESMTRMMAMLAFLEAWGTKVIILTVGASHKRIFIENFDTTVAGASWLLKLFLLLLFGECTWHALRSIGLGLPSNGLGGAVHDL
jgi:hypothetical protein